MGRKKGSQNKEKPPKEVSLSAEQRLFIIAELIYEFVEEEVERTRRRGQLSG